MWMKNGLFDPLFSNFAIQGGKVKSKIP